MIAVSMAKTMRMIVASSREMPRSRKRSLLDIGAHRIDEVVVARHGAVLSGFRVDLFVRARGEHDHVQALIRAEYKPRRDPRYRGRRRGIEERHVDGISIPPRIRVDRAAQVRAARR